MDIWRHGKYLDLWSLVHFLSGFLLCGLFYWLGVSFLWTLIISTALLVLWEVFEFIIKIIERSVNVVVDIIVGLLGFFLAAWLYFFKPGFDPYLFSSIATFTFFLALWGFLNFLKKGYH